MGFVYLLLFLLPVAAIGYIVWDQRRKKTAKDAASNARLEEILAVATNAPPSEPAPKGEAPAPGAIAGSPVRGAIAASPEPSAATPAAYLPRERVLTPPQTLLYYLLRTGLPDHVIFAQTPVASVLEPGATLAAYAREEQARIFARQVVDFVIADKSTRPVAIVKLIASGDAPQGSLSQMRTWFAAVGMRFIELDPAALPRKEGVRALVLGDAGSQGTREHDASRSA